MRATVLFATMTMTIAMAMAGPARADEVTDALASARTAYEAGKLGETAAALIAASNAVRALQVDKLAGFLPEAPDGWTREISTDGGAGMAMMGMGGTAAEGQYSHGDGRYVTITLTADSPLLAGMAGMLGSPQMMAMMGKVMKVGGIDMLSQDMSLSGMVALRVLVQAQGAEAEVMAELMEPMDFARLAQFDQ